MNDNTINLEKLLDKNLKIPKYQRPYEWNKKNVYTLLEDIFDRYNDKKSKDNSINLGAIILYVENRKSNIVDGQQRIITLSLLLKSLEEKIDLKILNEEILCNTKSINNIVSNYNSLKKIIERLQKKDNLNIDEFKEYLNKKVFFYIIEAESTEESFQLFDGRNTKYKDLSPVDLLKAYHLGALTSNKIEIKKQILRQWNKNINKYFKLTDNIYLDKSTNKIDYLYNNVLFRINNWTLNKDATDFTKDDIYLYKGYKKDNKYNYVNHYKTLNKRILQINKPFKSGEGFFEMTNYYIKEYDKLLKTYGQHERMKDLYKEDYYEKLYYNHNLYFNALLLYKDRFGKIRNNFYDEVIDNYIFKWSYTHRIKHEMVKFSSINYYVVHKNNNFFFNCNKALDIDELLSLEIEDKGKNPSKIEMSSELRRKLWKKLD